MEKIAQLILLTVYCIDKGDGVSTKLLENVLRPFSIDYEERYRYQNMLTTKEFLNKEDQTYKITNSGIDILKKTDILDLIIGFKNERSRVTVDFLLDKWDKKN